MAGKIKRIQGEICKGIHRAFPAEVSGKIPKVIPEKIPEKYPGEICKRITGIFKTTFLKKSLEKFLRHP